MRGSRLYGPPLRRTLLEDQPGKVARRLTRRSTRQAPYKSGGERSTSSIAKEPVVRMEKLVIKKIEDANFQLPLFRRPETAGTEEQPLPSTSRMGPSLSPACTEESEARPAECENLAARTLGVNHSWLMKENAPDREDDAIEVDSIDGEEAHDIKPEDSVSVTSSAENMVEEQREKRGRGHPPTTCEHVGKRQKEEKAALRKKKEGRTRRATEATPPTLTARWRRLLEQKEEVEDTLLHKPTETIAAQLMEHSAILYKVADCSNGMKEELVKQVKDTVA